MNIVADLFSGFAGKQCAMSVCTEPLRPAVQVENVKKGFPYIMFGDGHLASCKPISEGDLASFMAECIEDQQKVNQVLPIGGAQNATLLGVCMNALLC